MPVTTIDTRRPKIELRATTGQSRAEKCSDHNTNVSCLIGEQNSAPLLTSLVPPNKRRGRRGVNMRETGAAQQEVSVCDRISSFPHNRQFFIFFGSDAPLGAVSKRSDKGPQQGFLARDRLLTVWLTFLEDDCRN